MKKYLITKLVYATSPSDALLREDKGMIIDIGMADEITEEDYKTHLAKRNAYKDFYDGRDKVV